jgi:hypothetical protein
MQKAFRKQSPVNGGHFFFVSLGRLSKSINAYRTARCAAAVAADAVLALVHDPYRRTRKRTCPVRYRTVPHLSS